MQSKDYVPEVSHGADLARAFDSEELQRSEEAYVYPGKLAEAKSELLLKNSGTGLKFDDNKPRMDLLAPESLLEMAKVLTYGVNKYDKVNRAYNWRFGMAWSRPLAAAFRHLSAWMMGERFDKESGLSHLAHAAVNIMFLISYEITETGQDDRWKGVPQK